MNYDGYIITTLVGTVALVLNLLWTWIFCCKLEIVCEDGSTFVVTIPWGKIIDGELLILFLWDPITQRLWTSLSKTMVYRNWEMIRSTVWPSILVRPQTCCWRSKWSSSARNRWDDQFSLDSTWMLKSPTIRTFPHEVTIPSRKQAKWSMEWLILLGKGLYTKERSMWTEIT